MLKIMHNTHVATTNPAPRRKPVLGWLSVANAAVLCALTVALPTVVVSRSDVASPGGGSIGATAGGVGSVALAIITLDFALGLSIALAGALRRERPLWVHGLGAILTLGAPVVAIGILGLVYR